MRCWYLSDIKMFWIKIESSLIIVGRKKIIWDDYLKILLNSVIRRRCKTSEKLWILGLKNNPYHKTELIIFAPKHRVNDLSNCHLSIGGNIVSSAECIQNLGVYFDEALSMSKQVSGISKSCFHQIRNIGRIRQYITEDACRTLICSLVTFRLDYGNVLLYGLPTSVIQRLQRVQSTAARMITRQKKSDHITPVLHSLHWLPVSYRCQYKLLLYVFKAVIQKAPMYLQALIQVHKPSRSIRSGTRSLLTTPSVRTKTFGERRFERCSCHFGQCSVNSTGPWCRKTVGRIWSRTKSGFS
jgi:hypothetical protein